MSSTDISEEKLYRVVWEHKKRLEVFGVVTKGDIILRTAPIIAKFTGQRKTALFDWLESKGAIIEEI